MRSIWQACIDRQYDPFNFIASRPLRVARVLVDPSHVLSHLWFNCLQEEVVYGVQDIRKDEFRPGEDAKLIAG